MHLAGVGLIALKLALIPVVMDPVGADPFTLPKSAVSRVLMGILLALTGLYVLRQRARPRRLDPLAVAIMGLVLVSSLAAYFAIDRTAALFGAHRRQLGLSSLIDGVLLAVAVAVFLRTRRDLAAVLAGLAVGLTVTLAYAILQLAKLDPIRWAEPTTGSLIGNSTSLGGYLVIVSAALVSAVVIGWRQLAPRLRLGISALVLIALVIIGATGSLAAALALGPALAFGAMIVHRAGFRPAGVTLKQLGVAAGGVILLTAPLALAATERVGRFVQGQDLSATERSVIYRVALDGISRSPILGVGPDGLASVYLIYRPAEAAQMLLAPTQTSTHSWVLHQALGTGLVGLLMFIAVITISARRGWQLAPSAPGVGAAIGAVIVVAYASQGLFTINNIVTDLLLWTGIGLTAARLEIEGAAKVARGRVHLREAVGVVAATVIAVILYVGVFESNRAVHVSNGARAAGNAVLAEGSASHAVARDPGRADAWNVLGLAYSRRLPDRAADAFAQAASRAPRDPVYLLNQAAELAVLGAQDESQRAKAEAAARRAVELDPNGPVTLRRAAEILWVTGHLGDAIRSAEKMSNLIPQDLGARDLLARLYTEAGRPADAIAQIELMVRLNPDHASLPRLHLPRDLRLRLARLYAQVGQLEDARALVRPPTVVTVDLSCTPRNGTATTESGAARPRCVRVVFASEIPLREDESPGSAANLRNYAVGEVSFPAGSNIEVGDSTTVTIHLPEGAVPPARPSLVTVRAVENQFGQEMQPRVASQMLP